MFKNVIAGNSTSEIFVAGEALVRGMAVVKDYAVPDANKADAVGIGVFFADKDYVPTGVYSDVELTESSTEANAIAVGERFIAKKLMSGVWATDQIDMTGVVAGDSLKAGAGLLVKAVATDVCNMKYVGTYDFAGNTLHSFEIVDMHTV